MPRNRLQKYQKLMRELKEVQDTIADIMSLKPNETGTKLTNIMAHEVSGAIVITNIIIKRGYYTFDKEEEKKERSVKEFKPSALNRAGWGGIE